MTLPGPISQYIAILRIRQSATRRNLILSGLFFVLWVIALLIFVLSPVSSLAGLVFLAMMMALAALGLIFAWFEHNMLKKTLELLAVLQREMEESSTRPVQPMFKLPGGNDPNAQNNQV